MVLRTCFAGFESVICSLLALPEASRFFRKALREGTCLGVRCVTTRCSISFKDMKRSKAATAIAAQA